MDALLVWTVQCCSALHALHYSEYLQLPLVVLCEILQQSTLLNQRLSLAKGFKKYFAGMQSPTTTRGCGIPEAEATCFYALTWVWQSLSLC